MRLALTREQERFRGDVERFLHDELPQRVADKVRHGKGISKQNWLNGPARSIKKAGRHLIGRRNTVAQDGISCKDTCLMLLVAKHMRLCPQLSGSIW